MKFFDRWFQKQCKKAWNAVKYDADECEKESYASTSVSSMSKRSTRVSKLKNESDMIEDVSCYTFKMQPAEGGTIVQIMHYIEHQNQNGDWVKDLYIIPDTKDFGSELTSILVHYKLKHQ